MNLNDIQIEPSSYKDADGFVFYSGNKVYRKIKSRFVEQYLQLKKNGIYSGLSEQSYLFPFTEINKEGELFLESEKIEFISYPYEWGFEQMKAAALFHLDFIEACLSKNCFPKDASPYNIQFVNGKPVFIDILSLAPYVENTPWNAYKQFCELFLAPLLLSHYFPSNWNSELIIHPEGIPLKKAAALLPFKAKFNSLALLHIIAHAQAENKN